MFGGYSKTWSSTRCRSGIRRVSSRRTTWASSRASGAPTQKWMPSPKARWLRAFGRLRSMASGCSNVVSSWFAEPSMSRTREPSGRSTSPTRRRLLRQAPPGEHRRRDAQHLLDARRDELGVGADVLPAPPLDQQVLEAAGEQGARRLVARRELGVDEAGHLVDREGVVALLVDPHEVGGQVVARVVEARLHELQAVAPVAHEVVRVLLLLLDREVAEGQRDAAGRPALDVGDVLVGHAEEAEDDERRQLVGERRDEVERARCRRSRRASAWRSRGSAARARRRAAA